MEVIYVFHETLW